MHVLEVVGIDDGRSNENGDDKNFGMSQGTKLLYEYTPSRVAVNMIFLNQKIIFRKKKNRRPYKNKGF